MVMEATIFTGWIYDHLLPYAERLKVAHPLMLRAIAASRKKNNRIDAVRSPIAEKRPRSQRCRLDIELLLQSIGDLGPSGC